MNNAQDPAMLDMEIHQHERTLEFARKENDTPKMIGALREMGRVYLQDGDAPKALTQVEEAIDLAEEIEAEEELARLWGFKGMALKEIGNFQLARAAFNKSNQIARQLEHQTLVCDSLIRIGMLQAETGDVTKGISKLEQAYAIAVEEDDKKRIINIAMVLGNYFFRLESSAKAMEYYLDALTTTRDLKDLASENRVLLAMGNVQLQGEEYAGALENFETALKIASAREDAAAQLGALNGLMRANAYLDKVSMAQLYGEKALAMTQAAGNLESEMQVLEALISLLIGREVYRPTLEHFERALSIAAEKQAVDRKLSLLTGLGYVYYQLGEAEQARGAYEELRQEAERMQDKVAESTALSRLSAIYTEAGEVEQALDYAQQALERANDSDNAALVAEQQMLVALAHRDVGDDRKAYLFFENAIQGYESLGEEELARQIGEMQKQVPA